jgi:DNA-binding protein YbaB
VKVFVNGQQRPKGIDIDDNYLREVSPEDLVADITAAMQDAHAKSTEQLQKKMQSLYSDLGLPAP